MNRHVKEFHLLSLPEAFELAQNISDGIATVDDIPGDGSKRISSDTINSAPANSQSWKYSTIYSATSHQFDLFCTSTALIRLPYFDIFANLCFLLVEKDMSKYSFGRSKVPKILKWSKNRKVRTDAFPYFVQSRNVFKKSKF